MAIIATYFLSSSFLKLFTGIDICIPCIWKLLFHVDCPGCGLTTAFIHLLDFDLKAALNANYLIFILLPIGGYYILNDFIQFSKSLQSNSVEDNYSNNHSIA